MITSANTPSTTLIQEKYIVRKQDGQILEPGSYFVIRDTDLFSAPGLWAYAQAIMTIVEMSNTREGILTDEEREHMKSVMDVAATLASAWQQAGKGRLPD